MRTTPLVMTCFGLLLASGCGGSPTALPHVQGRVYFRGKPLTGGTIVFTPDPQRGGSGPMAWAEIGPDGRFRLFTEGRVGAAPGWHRITIAGKAEALPAHYRDPELSEQRFEVRPDRANLCELHLD